MTHDDAVSQPARCEGPEHIPRVEAYDGFKMLLVMMTRLEEGKRYCMHV